MNQKTHEEEDVRRRKAALLLLALGPEISADVLLHLSGAEVECLLSELAALDSVDAAERYETLNEFCVCMEAARRGSSDAVGTTRAEEFHPARVLELAATEPPRNIALLISRMEPEDAAFVMRSLPRAIQADIARRIAAMDRESPETQVGVGGMVSAAGAGESEILPASPDD